MKEKRKKICLISSCGGHLEQLFQLKSILNKYECFFVTSKTVATENMTYKKYFTNDLYRGKWKIVKIYQIICMFFKQSIIFFREKPDIILTTGAGLAVPMCIIGKIFKKKIIYIESFARKNYPNKSGMFIYKFADLFIIQWDTLKKFYPNALYWGWIY